MSLVENEHEEMRENRFQMIISYLKKAFKNPIDPEIKKEDSKMLKLILGSKRSQTSLISFFPKK